MDAFKTYRSPNDISEVYSGLSLHTSWLLSCRFLWKWMHLKAKHRRQKSLDAQEWLELHYEVVETFTPSGAFSLRPLLPRVFWGQIQFKPWRKPKLELLGQYIILETGFQPKSLSPIGRSQFAGLTHYPWTSMSLI
jgi:hypothetical protein